MWLNTIRRLRSVDEYRDQRYPAPLPPLRHKPERSSYEDRCETRYLLALVAAYLIAIFVLLPLLLMGKFS